MAEVAAEDKRKDEQDNQKVLYCYIRLILRMFEWLGINTFLNYTSQRFERWHFIVIGLMFAYDFLISLMMVSSQFSLC